MRAAVFLIPVLFIALLFSCKNRVYLTVAEPPAVYLEDEYETVGVINRTYSSGASKVADVIDNALTLEGDLDHVGSKAAVQGAFDELSTNQRFKKVALLDSMTVENGGIDVFPAQLSWDEVDQICRENGVQVLFVLEVFDTDTKIAYSQNSTTKSTPLGDIPVITHTATLTTNIKTAWRIYDPVNKWVRDEFWMSDRLVTSGSGINPAKAASVLMKRGQAVRQISNQVGRMYARRINEQRFRVWRNYFDKGSKMLKRAGRRAEVNDWDGAAELWLKETESPKRKAAGRACHNMAIYAEINGDLYGALEWTQKAYADYRIKESEDYARTLRNRVRRWERNQQLKEMDNSN